MRNSNYFLEIEDAKEFEEQSKQMFEYAVHPDLIEASCYFQKGAELMQKYLTSKAIAESREEELKVESVKPKTLIEKMRGVMKL